MDTKKGQTGLLLTWWLQIDGVVSRVKVFQMNEDICAIAMHTNHRQRPAQEAGKGAGNRQPKAEAGHWTGSGLRRRDYVVKDEVHVGGIAGVLNGGLCGGRPLIRGCEHVLVDARQEFGANAATKIRHPTQTERENCGTDITIENVIESKRAPSMLLSPRNGRL